MTDSLESRGLDKGAACISWANLRFSEEIAEIEEFLWNADIGNVLCEQLKTATINEIKVTLSICLRKFLRYPGIQCRGIQLLQDCHVLFPNGITSEEVDDIFDTAIQILDFYMKNSPDVVTHVFELLAMLCDKDIMKHRNPEIDLKCRELRRSGESSLLQCIIKAIHMHSKVKTVQRGGMLLIDEIFSFVAVDNLPSTTFKIFKCVMETLFRNCDDSAICFSSFSVLSQIAVQQFNLMSSWLDQIIHLAVRTISKRFSAEVVSKCICLLDSIAKEDAVLLKIAAALQQLSRVESLAPCPVKPGFVIRTKRLLPPQWKKGKEIEKVFINVFHHPKIEAVFKAEDDDCDNESNRQGMNSEENGDDEEGESGIVVVTCGEAAITEDGDGVPCVLYNLAVSSQYFPSSSSEGHDDASTRSSTSITSVRAVRKLIRELNIKFGDYLDETNFSLPLIHARFKGNRIPHLLFNQGSRDGELNCASSLTSQDERESEVGPAAVPRSGGLLVLCEAIGLMSCSNISTQQHLDAIIMCLELTFRVLVDEHCSAVIFQDAVATTSLASAPASTSSPIVAPSIFQTIITALSRQIIRLSEEASDDLEITKMDYLNLLFNSIVENLEFLESGESDFRQVLLSHSVAFAASSPIGKRAPGKSLYRSFKLSQRLPVLTYSAGEGVVDTVADKDQQQDGGDEDDDDEDIEEERTRCEQRLHWGPLLITIGPQLCDKVPFLQSLQEDVRAISIDDTPGLYEPVYVAVALEVWKKEAVSCSEHLQVAEFGQVVSFLQRRQLFGVSVFERLMRLRLKEVMFVTLLFHRMISPAEFEEAMDRLIPDENTRAIFVDSVAEVYISFESMEQNPDPPPMMSSATLDLFITEAAMQATASSAKDMKSAIKTVPSLVCWANTNIIPDFYAHILAYAEKYHRIVRFVRWGSEIPRLSASELMKRNIRRFLSSGRYVEAAKLMAFFQAAESMFNSSHGTRMEYSEVEGSESFLGGFKADFNVTLTHPEVASRAGYFMDPVGRVVSSSRPNINQIIAASAYASPGGKKKTCSRWNVWKNNGLVFPIVYDSLSPERDADLELPANVVRALSATTNADNNGRRKNSRNVRVSFSVSAEDSCSRSPLVELSPSPSPLAISKAPASAKERERKATDRTHSKSTPESKISAENGRANNIHDIKNRLVRTRMMQKAVHQAESRAGDEVPEPEDLLQLASVSNDNSHRQAVFMTSSGCSSPMTMPCGDASSFACKSLSLSSDEPNLGIEVFYYSPEDLPSDGPEFMYSQIVAVESNVIPNNSTPVNKENSKKEEMKSTVIPKIKLEEENSNSGHFKDSKKSGWHRELSAEEKSQEKVGSSNNEVDRKNGAAVCEEANPSKDKEITSRKSIDPEIATVETVKGIAMTGKSVSEASRSSSPMARFFSSPAPRNSCVSPKPVQKHHLRSNSLSSEASSQSPSRQPWSQSSGQSKVVDNSTSRKGYRSPSPNSTSTPTTRSQKSTATASTPVTAESSINRSNGMSPKKEHRRAYSGPISTPLGPVTSTTRSPSPTAAYNPSILQQLPDYDSSFPSRSSSPNPTNGNKVGPLPLLRLSTYSYDHNDQGKGGNNTVSNIEPCKGDTCPSYPLAIAGLLEAIGIGAEAILTSPFAQMRNCSCSKCSVLQQQRTSPDQRHYSHYNNHHQLQLQFSLENFREVSSDAGLELLNSLAKRIFVLFAYIREESKGHHSKGYSSTGGGGSSAMHSPSGNASSSNSNDPNSMSNRSLQLLQSKLLLSSISTVSIKLLKTTVQKMGLLDEVSLKTRDLEIILASYGGAQRVTVFEMAHCLLLSGKKRYTSPLYCASESVLLLLEGMSIKVDELMNKLREETLDAAVAHPLLPHQPLLGSAAFDVRKLLEGERRPLFCIYQGYAASRGEQTTKWETKKAAFKMTGSSGKAQVDATHLRSPVRRKLSVLTLSPATGTAGSSSGSGAGSGNSHAATNKTPTNNSNGGDGCSSSGSGWLFASLLQFATDFIICPDLVSRQQLAELFNLVLVDPRMTSVGEFPPRHMIVDTTDQSLSFNQFLDLLVQIALRSPVLSSSQSPWSKVMSLLLLLNQSTSKQKILERCNVNSLIFCCNKGHPPGRQVSLSPSKRLAVNIM